MNYGRRITRKDAEYVAAKIAAIHGKPFSKSGQWDRDQEAEEVWFADYEAQYGGIEIRAWHKGSSGEFTPLGGPGARRTPRDFFEWGNAYVKGALEFGGPELRERLDRFFQENPIA